MEKNELNKEALTPEVEPTRRRAARRLRRAEIYYGISLAAFAVLAAFAHFNAYFDWDLRAAHALQNVASPGMYALMRAISIFGDKLMPFILTAITALAFFAFRRRSEAYGLALSAGGSAVLNFLIKVIVARPRPSSDLVTVFRDLHTRSFPSGHVTFYVCFFGFLFFVAYALLPRGSWARRGALVLTALPVALVGLSRVYLGEHWPSDVIGSYLWSGVWLALSLRVYRHWKAHATFKPDMAGAAS